MVIFFLIFLTTNVIFGLIICSAFMRLDKEREYDISEFLLYSFALSPAFTTLILYYSFLIAPRHSNSFYYILIFSLYSLLTIYGVKYFKPIFHELKDKIQKTFFFRGTQITNVENIIIVSLIFIPVFAYLMVYITKILPQPLIGNDILDYGITGRMLFEGKSLDPIWLKTFSDKGYYYDILHPPSFSLLLTWEMLISSLFNYKSDLYFKSVSAYYGFLILGIQYMLVAKQNKWLAIFSTISLLSGLSFFLIFFQRSIDSYRITFIGVSWIFLFYHLKKKDVLSLIMLGIFTGFAAFSHRIGLIFAAINYIAFLIALEAKWIVKAQYAIILLILMTLFGSVHYLFDITWGSGEWLQIK